MPDLIAIVKKLCFYILIYKKLWGSKIVITSIISFAGVFSLVVLIHEFGHFIAARRAGVKVYEFSIGFPFSPRLITLFHHKETEFTLRLLPLGGFVSFSKDGDDEAREFMGASFMKRIMILSAGSLFNIFFAFIIFIPVFMAGKNLYFFDALLLSVKTVYEIISGTILFILNILSGNGTMEGLSGPVGIAAMAGKAATKGILSLMFFTGALSMSLGIMNLFPFPALDGGQLFMLFVESITKRSFTPRIYQITNLFGMAMFIILSIFITYKDIVKLIA